MIKKFAFLLVALALLAVPLLTACNGGTTTSTATSTDTSTVYKLTINDHNPAGTGPATSVDLWADYVEQQSGGRLDLEVIHGAALFTGDEVYGQIAQGGCDGGDYVVREEDGFLLTLALTLPFLGFPEQHFEDAFYTLWDEYPEFAGEWDEVTVIGMMIMPGTQFHTVSKAINTPADIKGVKMFCAETSLVNIVNAVGGVGVQQPITDMAPSVQTGLVEGVFNHYPVLNVFGALELLHSHTEFGGGVNFTPMFMLVSNQALAKLPADLQDVVINSGDYWFTEFKRLDDADMTNALAVCEANNDKFIKLSSSQVADWRALIQTDVIDAWINKCEAAGLPGQKVYDRLMELISQM